MDEFVFNRLGTILLCYAYAVCARRTQPTPFHASIGSGAYAIVSKQIRFIPSAEEEKSLPRVIKMSVGHNAVDHMHIRCECM